MSCAWLAGHKFARVENAKAVTQKASDVFLPISYRSLTLSLTLSLTITPTPTPLLTKSHPFASSLAPPHSLALTVSHSQYLTHTLSVSLTVYCVEVIDISHITSQFFWYYSLTYALQSCICMCCYCYCYKVECIL
jgi:hypothetical protein